MSKLVIVVPVGRRAAGRAVLLGSDGKLRLAPFRVLATAAGSAATRHGNPGRDWRKAFGDTPTGSYVIAGALPPGATANPGPEGARADLLGAVVLAPVGGNALEALRAGRTRFLVHGGPADSRGRLRSTFGGLRVSDADLARLLAAINAANADRDPVSSVEVDETSAPAWTEEAIDEVPSSRGGPSRAAASPVTRGVLAAFGFGPSVRSRAPGRAAPAANPSRRAFVGLALFTFGALAFACEGREDVGAGGGDGGDGGHDGGGAGGGYDGAPEAADGGREDGDAGPEGGHGTGGSGGTTTGGTGTDTTTTGTDTTTTGTDTTTTGTDTTTTGTVTTGTDTTTTGTVTTGTDTTTTGTVTTGTDTTTTGTDTTTTGTDTTTTGTDTTTTGTDTTTTGTDTTTTGTDTTTTGTDTTTTGTDTTTTGFMTPFRRRRKRRKPPADEGSGT